MTNTLRRFLRGHAAPGVLALGVLLGSTRAEAQAPARDPAPPAPQPATQPPVLRPPTTPPPPAPGTPAAAAASAAPATAAPVLPPTRASSVPPDSVRPAAAASVMARPANAIAQCGDGSFVVPPQNTGACANRGGLRATFPQAAVPPRPTAGAAPVAGAPANLAVMPSGATMRCKDGTYLFGAPDAGRCSQNGGLAAILVAPRSDPPPPSQPRRP